VWNQVLRALNRLRARNTSPLPLTSSCLQMQFMSTDNGNGVEGAVEGEDGGEGYESMRYSRDTQRSQWTDCGCGEGARCRRLFYRYHKGRDGAEHRGGRGGSSSPHMSPVRGSDVGGVWGCGRQGMEDKCGEEEGAVAWNEALLSPEGGRRKGEIVSSEEEVGTRLSANYVSDMEAAIEVERRDIEIELK